MKNLLLATVLVVGASLYTNDTEAQLRVNVNLNIGGTRAPSWGLPGKQMGNFYYLPEIDSYYDLQRAQFVYFDRGQWIYASQLPGRYRNYNLSRGYKVFVNEARPYIHADVYRKKYNRYYNTYRWDDDRFDRGRNNQHFDNRRFEDHNDNNGRWKSERGRG